MRRKGSLSAVIASIPKDGGGSPRAKPKRRTPSGHDPGYYAMAKRNGWVQYPNGELKPDDGSGRGSKLR